VAASHFFVGLGAGLALLTLPVVALAPGSDLPGRFVAWIDGGPRTATSNAGVSSLTRPVRGFVPGEPTPDPAAPPPTLAPAARPTAVPPPPPPTLALPPSGSAMRTGIIRSGGRPVSVRRAAGVEGPGDPVLADGSPVLVSAGSDLEVGGQAWRAIRGLNGVVGWVPSAQLNVDGELPAGARATVTSVATAERLRVANTGGSGVALRASPRDEDRLPRGLVDGTQVGVLERSGTDWVRVRADNGAEGWVPARYLAP
jgi:SH3-like domain-containing protein